MALSCGAKCAKGVLITFNLIFWLSGCALIAFGIYILIEEEKTALFRLFTEGGGEEGGAQYAHLQYLAFAFIGIGGLVFIVGFFGCCGAMQENKCMLVAYFIFLFIILGCELAVGVLAVVFNEKGTEGLEEKFKETLKTKYGLDQPITQAIDLAQTKFECCGVRDGADYADSSWKRRVNADKSVSPTCCVLRNPGQPDSHLNPQPLNESMCQRDDSMNLKFRHQAGCKNKLEEYLKDESMIFLGLGCIVAALEIFGMIFSICLCITHIRCFSEYDPYPSAPERQRRHERNHPPQTNGKLESFHWVSQAKSGGITFHRAYRKSETVIAEDLGKLAPEWTAKIGMGYFVKTSNLAKIDGNFWGSNKRLFFILFTISLLVISGLLKGLGKDADTIYKMTEMEWPLLILSDSIRDSRQADVIF